MVSDKENAERAKRVKEGQSNKDVGKSTKGSELQGKQKRMIKRRVRFIETA